MPNIKSYLNENIVKVEFKFLNEIGSQDSFFFFFNPLENEQMSFSQCYQIIERGHPLGHKGENRQCWLQDTFKCSNQHSGSWMARGCFVAVVLNPSIVIGSAITCS